ncbi:hypothetical protein Bcen2424_2749 [Burkholderia cenocepacia HI2424]|nr:hypothetical protein Bcen2424_2749 [Burkholderia cenocepacia HI2424]
MASESVRGLSLHFVSQLLVSFVRRSLRVFTRPPRPRFFACPERHAACRTRIPLFRSLHYQAARSISLRVHHATDARPASHQDEPAYPHVVAIRVIRYCANPGRHVFSCAGKCSRVVVTGK